MIPRVEVSTSGVSDTTNTRPDSQFRPVVFNHHGYRRHRSQFVTVKVIVWECDNEPAEPLTMMFEVAPVGVVLGDPLAD